MTHSKKLLGPFDLLSESWEAFSSSWKTLVGVKVLSVLYVLGSLVVFSLPIAALYFINNTFFEQPIALFFLVLYFLLCSLAVLLIGVWGQIAFLLAVMRPEKKMGIFQAFSLAQQEGVLWGVVVLILLKSLLILTGLFFLLVPAFIFSIWFTFAMFVFLEKRCSPITAILTSKEYIRGRFWPVVGRLLVIAAFIGGVEMLAATIPFFGILLSILIAPVGTIYAYELYKDLKKTHGEVEPKVRDREKIFFQTMAILGIILIVLMFVSGSAIAKMVKDEKERKEDGYQRCLESKMRYENGGDYHLDCVPPDTEFAS